MRIGHPKGARSTATQLTWTGRAPGPVCHALETLRLEASVDYTDTFPHLVAACPALIQLDVRRADSYLLTLLRMHTDWLPRLAALTYAGSPGHAPSWTMVRDLLRVRPHLVALRLHKIPAECVPPLRGHLAAFAFVTPTNPTVRKHYSEWSLACRRV